MFLFRSAMATIICVVLLTASSVARQPAEIKEPSLRDVILRLDALADRIESLDKRLRRLENTLLGTLGRVDEYGIIRDATGRPIGVWGVDINPQPALRPALRPARR